MLPRAKVVHKISGRVRFSISEAARNSGWFQAVVDRLMECPGVEYVEASPLTATLLVIHKSSVPELTEYAAQEELFELEEIPDRHELLSSRLIKGLDRLGKQVESFAGGEADVPGMAAVGLVVVGLTQMARHRTWPAGATLVWYALNILKDIRKNGAASRGTAQAEPEIPRAERRRSAEARPAKVN
jgi:hypothetical protein